MALNWVSGDDVANAVEEYVKMIANMQRRTTHVSGTTWCVDQHKNQVKGCRCVFDLYKKKNEGTDEDKLDYELICCEMASWYSDAKRTENLRFESQITPTDFKICFYKTTVLMSHRGTGAITKMVNMSRMPVPSEVVNISVITADETFCLNTVLGLWKVLICRKEDDIREWKTINYRAILYQGARNKIDALTQKKRQKLFYSRLFDFLNARRDQVRISYKYAAECYQSRNELSTNKDAVKTWRELNWYNWRNWKLDSIHILVANSSLNYSEATKRLVEEHNIAIASVSDATISTLHRLMETLWRRKNTHWWKKVTQDKELWFMPFPPSNNILAALDAKFRYNEGGRATGVLGDLLNVDDQRGEIAEADAEIRKVILEQLNLKRGKKSNIKSVAFQPSFLMSEKHEPQHAHFDYRWDDKNRKGEQIDNQKKFWIGFLPIAEFGQFLQLWKYKDNIQEVCAGEIVFIPKGHLVMVRGDTLHGGGFRAETGSGNSGAHARLHFYIYPGVDECPMVSHGNEYNDPSKERMVSLAKFYKNSELLEGVLEGGGWSESMNWTFFQGECPIDPKTGIEMKQRVLRKACSTESEDSDDEK